MRPKEALQFEGHAIISELKRQIKLQEGQRPLMSVFTNSTDFPEYTGGIEYVPMTLEALASRLNLDGTVASVTASFKMIEGKETVMRLGASYDPSETVESPRERRIRKITVYSNRKYLDQLLV